MKEKKQTKATEKRLELWQERLVQCCSAYAERLLQMQEDTALYEGTREITEAKKQAGNVRNIVFELIESEVDSTIPQPRVTARAAEDAGLAAVIEDTPSDADRIAALEAAMLTLMEGTSNV